MSFSWNLVVQIVSTLIQVLNAVGNILPDHQVSISLGVGILQSIVAAISHFSNPDGTAAVKPYEKKPQL